MEFVDWLLWFALIPVGGALLVGALLWLWVRRMVLTRLRAWLVTLGLTGLFLALEYFLIYHFAYLLPD